MSSPSEPMATTSSRGPVGAERDAERGQVGAADVVGDEPVSAAERGRVDPLDVVEVHQDVADVAGEAHAPAVRRHVEDLRHARAVEGQRVGAALALDRVAAVARVPDEAVVAGAEERDVAP